MTGWILSIVGMVLMVTLIEVMLPDGETSKYVKGVVSLMVVYVVLIPIPHFLNAKIDINTFFNFSEERYQINSSFIQIIKEDKQSYLSEELMSIFRREGLEASGSVFLNGSDEITIVLVSCITEEKDHAIELTMKTLGIKEDKIVIHEVAT